ncbi:MAG: sensor histidine kinase [Novosphingobium sp.]
MHFDDRISTVLRVRADGPALARIQFRQLLDLLGTQPVEREGPQVEAAFSRLAELANRISARDRAGMLAEPGLRLRSPRLVAALASDAAPVAQAAVRQAQLSDEQWLDLIPALPVGARGVVRHRRDLGPRASELLNRLGIHDRGLPAAEAAADEGIGALVRRIEAYRKAREVPAAANANDAPRLPLGEEHVLHAPPRPSSFDFATDPAGRIVWADPGVAAMVVGRAPFDTARAAQRRLPLSGLALTLGGASALAGGWQADAAPQFDPLSGRFTGYAGRMRRLPEAAAANTPATEPSMTRAERDADRIRQLLHELRTPVGAIQGFAEAIQQQIFGGVPHEYRALAAAVAGDAARVLAAFEELERFAKLESGGLAIEPGSADLAAIVAETVARLAPFTARRNSGFDARAKGEALAVPVAPIEAERIVWRLLATLAGTSTPGEVLALKISAEPEGVRLTIALPTLLAQRDEAGLFSAAVGSVPQTIASGMFGVGFALRLARSEARAAGGRLERRGNDLRLVLPGLTGSEAAHSHSAPPAAG